MTEAEWLTCDDPAAMAYSLADYQRDPHVARKLRLFAAHCCRNVLREGAPPQLPHTVEMLERLADGRVTAKEFYPIVHGLMELAPHPCADEALNALCLVAYDADDNPLHAAVYATEVCQRAADLGAETGTMESERALHKALLRDIFGNPFRPVAFSPEWRTDTALSLARQMYDSRDFSAMPILADSLQDAGCDSEDILSHCRGPGPHVRGCWVVDLVLGKE